MDVRAKHRFCLNAKLFLCIFIAGNCSEPPAVADGLYGAGYHLQQRQNSPAADSSRLLTPRREVSQPDAADDDAVPSTISAHPAVGAASAQSKTEPEKPSSLPTVPAPGKVTHSAAGVSLNDRDQTTDPWSVTDETLTEHKKTIVTASEKIKKDPQDASPYVSRANAYLFVWMSKLALDDSNKAISLNSADKLMTSNAYCNKGEALLQMDKCEDALIDLNKAISLDDENAEAYYFRGMAQEKLGRIDIAKKDYQQARDYGFAPKGVLDVDFGTYMADLQRSIKKAWHPPKGNETRKTIVTFKVYITGLLDNLKMMTTSGLETTNEAALSAVKEAAPFQPLPKGAPRSVDIHFSFDYNVLRKNMNTEERISELASAEKAAQEKVESAEKGGDQRVLLDALYGLGDAYREKRNYFFAENTYKRAQELSQKLDDGDIGASKVLARLALLDMDRGKKRDAEDLFNKSLDLAFKAGKSQTDPDTGIVLRDYARMLYKDNRFEDVKKMYARFKVI